MELALLKYTLIFSGVVVFFVAAFIFFRLTNWLVWLKGNVPFFVAVIGMCLALMGFSMQPYVAVSPVHSIMNASVQKLPDGQYKLLVDNGSDAIELIGHGDQWQAKVELVKPGFVMSVLGMTELAVLDSLTLEENSFEKSVLADGKEQWVRDYGFAGKFESVAVTNELHLSRQLPLVSGAIFGLVKRYGRLVWVGVNPIAEEALAE